MSQFLSWSQACVRAMLPRPVLEKIRAMRHEANARKYEAGVREQARAEWKALLHNWESQATPTPPETPPARPARPARPRILVFPSDPRAIMGSRGDDAMINAVLEAARSVAPDTEVDMFCEGDGIGIAAAMGFNPVAIGRDRDFPATAVKLLAECNYERYTALGADIIDGRFGARIPALMLVAADLAARAGVCSTILGCSFGEDPAPELNAVLRRLDSRVHLNMRDPVSLRRITAFAPVHATLVADAAFALMPGRPDAGTRAWIEAQRAAGRGVIGVNVHPMLVRDADAAWVEAMTASLAQALREVAGRKNVGWLLLPHDYREDFGDLSCLARVNDLLQDGGDARARLLDGAHSAADLKALVGCLDGVITGRMHLAIAALGMGVPALGLTYHDKFEGLYSLFGLPDSMLLPPSIFGDPGALARRIEDFVVAIPALADAIDKRHATVMGLAMKNFVDEPVNPD